MAKIIPIKDLKNTSEITEKCRTSDEPIFIIQNGHGDMMLMSMEVYNRTMAKMDLYQKQKKAEDQLLSGIPLRFPLISLWRRWKTSMKNCGIKLLPEEQKDIAEMLEYIAVTLCAPTAALKLYNVLLDRKSVV